MSTTVAVNSRIGNRPTYRPRRLQLTAATMVGLLLLSGLYSLGMQQVIVLSEAVPRPKLAALVSNTNQAPNSRLARQYLAQAPWAADAKYQFSTADAVIYTQEWTALDDNSAIRFRPFAVIWKQPPDSSGDRPRPVTIVSDSAILQFSGQFEVSGSDPGHVVGGALEGNVTIDGADGLHVVGRNFIYNEEALRAWSDHPLEFAYQSHTGSAHGVQVELVANTDESDQQVTGLKSLRLRRDVRMKLQLQNDPAEAPVPVMIQSQGRFEWSFDTLLATFEDQVQLIRPSGNNLFDSLTCDLLTLLFETDPEKTTATHEPTSKEQPAAGTASGTETPAGDPAVAANDADRDAMDDRDVQREIFGNANRKLRFRRLRAEGKRVVLNSQENQLTGHMTELIYDGQTEIIALLDGQTVRLNQGGSELLCPEITLKQQDGRLHSAWCRGAGKLNYRDPKSGDVILAAEWLWQLRKYPDGDTGLDILELQDHAVVQQPAEGIGLSGDVIRIWVTREAQDSADGEPRLLSVGTVAASAPEANEGNHPRSRVQPRRMLATGTVGFVSPDLLGETRRLEVAFVERPAKRQDSPRSADSRAKSNTRDSFGKNGSKNGPIQLTAASIRAEVTAGETSEDVALSSVWTEGDVTVTHPSVGDGPNLSLRCDRLQIESPRPNGEIFHVYGDPAHLRSDEVHIAGKAIHLDGGSKRAWVEGNGLMQLPVRQSLEGPELPADKLADIWWTEGMEFDGRAARFLTDVRLELDTSRLHCEQMDVLFDQPISFTEQNSDANRQTKPAIETVVCHGGVTFESQLVKESQLVEVRRARCWEMTLHQKTGASQAKGPGVINFWRRGTGRRAGLAPEARAQSNQPLEADAAEWEYTQVDFQRDAVGNFRQRNMTFHDRVQIVYGPVYRSMEEVDPNHLTEGSGWMRCDTLEVSQVDSVEKNGSGNRASEKNIGSEKNGSETFASQAKQPQGSVQLLASGNAELEGSTFHARADQISYDEAKGLYMLRSLGKQKATIWRQSALGADFSRAEAQRMEFLPARNQLKLDRATGVQGLQ